MLLVFVLFFLFIASPFLHVDRLVKATYVRAFPLVFHPSSFVVQTGLQSLFNVVDHMSTVWPIEHMYSQQDRSLSQFIGCLKAATKRLCRPPRWPMDFRFEIWRWIFFFFFCNNTRDVYRNWCEARCCLLRLFTRLWAFNQRHLLTFPAVLWHSGKRNLRGFTPMNYNQRTDGCTCDKKEGWEMNKWNQFQANILW